jgi:hypothetical protein
LLQIVKFAQTRAEDNVAGAVSYSVAAQALLD